MTTWPDIATPAARQRDRYVYALYAGRQLLPCYVGVGKGDRMHQHLRYVKRGDITRGNVRKNRTLRACWVSGIPIAASKLASNLTIDEACQLERLLIVIYGRRDLHTGCLLNAAAGGPGVLLQAPSTIKRLAEAGRRQMARPDFRRMLNERINAPETKAKMSAASKGRRPSVEAKAKMGAARRHRNEQFPEDKAWRSSFLRPNPGGYKHSIEARTKISEALRRQWSECPDLRAQNAARFNNPTSEQKALIDAARYGRTPMLGKKHSTQTRIKMALAQQERRERERARISD